MNLKVGESDYGKVNVAVDYENHFGYPTLLPSSCIKNYKSNLYFDHMSLKTYNDNIYPFLNWGTKTMCCENVISETKSITVAAYGLLPEEIVIKEIDGRLTVKSAPKVKANTQSNLNLSYTLKNVKLDSTTLALGVLTLDFVDTENVVIHKVNNGG